MVGGYRRPAILEAALALAELALRFVCAPELTQLIARPSIAADYPVSGANTELLGLLSITVQGADKN